MSEDILNLEEMQPQEIEDMARRMGHVSQDDFKGDPDKWVDAETFVKRAANELPIARGTIRNLNTKLERLESKIAKQAEVFEQFNEYHKTTLQRTAESEYNRGLDEARSRVKQAVEDGDVVAAEEALRDAENIMKAGPGKVEVEDKFHGDKPKVDPEINKEWISKHPWFLKDFKMNKFAREAGDFLAFSQPELTQRQQLDKIAEMVENEFPDYFGNPKRKEPGKVDSGDRGANPKNSNLKKGYNDLPPEAQQHCDAYCAEIPGFTKEQFLADYHGSWRS